MTNGYRAHKYSSDPTMTTKGPDVDFCSAEEEEFFEDIHSPTDNSEDSVDVKVSAISLKNKRKCSEPRKVNEQFTGPLKKRMCLKVKSEKGLDTPFRPWSPRHEDTNPNKPDMKPVFPTSFVMPQIPSMMTSYDFQNNKTETVPAVHHYFRPPSPKRYENNDEPVALVKKSIKKEDLTVKREDESSNHSESTSIESPRVPVHPQAVNMSTAETERLINSSTEAFPQLQKLDSDNSSMSAKREQRNYKNMTRERRIEANARERTRVHTISAAFDTLRKSVPSYSHNQKLSKLSILRIACSYIMTLSSIVNESDSAQTAECVELITKTIQREGKLRKKKDDND